MNETNKTLYDQLMDVNENIQIESNKLSLREEERSEIQDRMSRIKLTIQSEVANATNDQTGKPLYTNDLQRQNAIRHEEEACEQFQSDKEEIKQISGAIDEIRNEIEFLRGKRRAIELRYANETALLHSTGTAMIASTALLHATNEAAI